MDVVRVQSVLFAALLTSLLTGCLDLPNTQTSNFPETSSTCDGTAAPNRFVIRWKNGDTTIHENTTRDELIRDYIEDNDQIDFAEQDQVVKLSEPQVGEDSLVPSSSSWGQQMVEASAAWNSGVTGEGVTVAVIDSGVDRNHPQLRGRMAINTGEIPNDGIDNDGNGLVDDYAGYDFNEKSGNVTDGSGHGTHVSGIIAAEHQSGPVLGVAPGAKILPLDFMDDTGAGYISDAVLAVNYAVQRGAKVINASWGGPNCSRTLRTAIAGLESKGVLFVVAAGNSGADIDLYPEYPAAHGLSSQLTVAWSNENDNLDGNSNFGSMLVHLGAPGSNIYSTYPTSMSADGTRILSGTSMATPFVSATAALLWSVNPVATVQQVKAAIMASVDPRPFSVESRGRLNIRKAIAAIQQ